MEQTTVFFPIKNPFVVAFSGTDHKIFYADTIIHFKLPVTCAPALNTQIMFCCMFLVYVCYLQD